MNFCLEVWVWDSAPLHAGDHPSFAQTLKLWYLFSLINKNELRMNESWSQEQVQPLVRFRATWR